MAVTNAVFTLNSYTVATDTDLVPAAPNVTIATFIIANPTANAAIVGVKLTDETGASLAEVLPAFTVAAGEKYILDARSLNVPSTDYKLTVNVDVVGVTFLASGVAIT